MNKRTPQRKSNSTGSFDKRGSGSRSNSGSSKSYSSRSGKDSFGDKKTTSRYSDKPSKPGAKKPSNRFSDPQSAFRSKSDENNGFAKKRPYADDKPSFRKREDNGSGFPKRRSASSDEKPTFRRRDDNDSGFVKRRSSSADDKPTFRRREDSDSGFVKRRSSSSDDKPTFRKRDDNDSGFVKRRSSSADDKPTFRRREDNDNGFAKRRSASSDDKPTFRRREDNDNGFVKRRSASSDDKPAFRKREDSDSGFAKRRSASADEKPTFRKREESSRFSKNNKGEKRSYKKSYKADDGANSYDRPKFNNEVRLNKYLADAGVGSRREADVLIATGAVKVNGKIVTELGIKVSPSDKVDFGGETIKRERLRYILLNKPKDYITTAEDTHDRRTVLDLINGACTERVYPVGRLDRNTSGLLLITNDGELTKKLTHPKHEVKKIYHVELDKNVKAEDLKQIKEGIELEDGLIKVDEASYVQTKDGGVSKKEIGIEIHSGRNRIVRRIFEHLGYDVVKLDRVYFAGLTKKNINRGRWRFLTEMEINMLKMI